MSELIQFASSVNPERNASTTSTATHNNNSNNERSTANELSSTFASSTNTIPATISLVNNISTGVNTNTSEHATIVNNTNNDAVPREQEQTESIIATPLEQLHQQQQQQQQQEQEQTTSTQPEREIILLPTDFSPAPNPFHSVFDQFVHNAICNPSVERQEQSELARLRNQDSVTREELDLILDHLCSNDGERDFVNVFFVDYVNNDPTFIMPTLGLFHRTSSAGMRVRLIGSQWFRSAYERVLYLCLLNTFIRLFGAHLTLYRDLQFKFPPLPRSEMRLLERALLTQSLIKHLRTIGEISCSICQEEYADVFTSNRMEMFASIRTRYPECTTTELLSHLRRQCLEERQSWQLAQRAQQSLENENQNDTVQHHRWLHHTSWKQVEVCRLPCQHYFCWGCIHRWLMQTSTCPNCRIKLHQVREMYKMNAKATPLWWSTPLRVQIASCHAIKNNPVRIMEQTSNNSNNSNNNAPMLSSTSVSSSSSYSVLSSNPLEGNSQRERERERETQMSTELSPTHNSTPASQIVNEVHEENVNVESSIPTFMEFNHNRNITTIESNNDNSISRVNEEHTAMEQPEEQEHQQQLHEQALSTVNNNNNLGSNSSVHVESQTTYSVPHSRRFVSLRNASIPMMDIYRANIINNINRSNNYNNININHGSVFEHHLVNSNSNGNNNVNYGESSENRIYGPWLSSVQTIISTSGQSSRSLPLYMPAINTQTTTTSFPMHYVSLHSMTNTAEPLAQYNHYTFPTQAIGISGTNSVGDRGENVRTSQTRIAAMNMHSVRNTHTAPNNAHDWVPLQRNRRTAGVNLLESHISSLESSSYSSSSSSDSYDDEDAESSASWNECNSDSTSPSTSSSDNSDDDDMHEIHANVVTNVNRNHSPHHRPREDLHHHHHHHSQSRKEEEEEEQLFFHPAQPISEEVKEQWRQHASERLAEHDRLLGEEWKCEMERRRKLKEQKRNKGTRNKSVSYNCNTRTKGVATPRTNTFVSANYEDAGSSITVNSKVSNPLSAIPSRVNSSATTNKPTKSIVKRCWNKIIHHRKHKN